MKTLVLCENRSFLIYLLAFASQAEKEDSFDFYVEKNTDISIETVELAQQFNVKFISDLPSDFIMHDRLMVHAYNNTFANFLDEFKANFKSVTLYSDGIRNGFELARNLSTNTDQLVYFGFKLVELSALRSIPEQQFDLICNAKIVPIYLIQEVWRSLVAAHGLCDAFDLIEDNDLLLIMRYWGNPLHYPTKDVSAVSEFLVSAIRRSAPTRIVFKEHFQHMGDFDFRQFISAMNDSGMKLSVLDWNEIVKSSALFPELTSPEGFFWCKDQEHINLLAFDSSLNSVAAMRSKSLNLNAPSRADLERIFDQKPLIDKILQSYKNARNFQNFDVYASRPEMNKKEIVIYDAPLSRIYSDPLTQERDALTQERDALTQERDALTQERDALTQERDALTQERDALTQERDALTQERDALTQERDALTQSTIWRLSKPIRLFVSKIKHLFK